MKQHRKQHQIEHILNAWQDINLCDFVVFLSDTRKELPQNKEDEEAESWEGGWHSLGEEQRL